MKQIFIMFPTGWKEPLFSGGVLMSNNQMNDLADLNRLVVRDVMLPHCPEIENFLRTL